MCVLYLHTSVFTNVACEIALVTSPSSGLHLYICTYVHHVKQLRKVTTGSEVKFARQVMLITPTRFVFLVNMFHLPVYVYLELLIC